MRIPLSEVEVIFGSSSRGDHDHLSDRDILIVDDAREILRARAGALQTAGWSVASYTWGKLDYMAQSGALFIQHLKSEGRVIRDANGRFGEFLAHYRPKGSYAPELRANAALAGLTAGYPHTLKGILWAADILYVCVRNFGVLSLAEEGIYMFSFANILSELGRRSILTTPQIKSYSISGR